MCRLLGLRANGSVDLEFSLVASTPPSRNVRRKGWGVGWYQRGGPSLKKEPLPAHDSGMSDHPAMDVDSELAIAHVRYVSSRDLKHEHCQPFCFGNWLFAHNGGLERKSLLQRLDKRHQESLQGETDSEVFFHWIHQNIEREGDVLSGLRASLSAVKDYTGLNFLLSDGQTLYAFRDAAKRHEYYSLFFLARDPLDGQPERFTSKELGLRIQSNSLRREKSVLICSEQLTSESWNPIELGHLFIVPESLVPTTVKIR
jgi:predicted glutamine amidotransferase